MILKLRIDDRLLHGQVAYSWKAEINYNAIVIVSNSAANDDLRKSMFKMCCPDGVKLATRSEEAAIKLLNNEQLKNMRVFVVTDSPKSAHAVLKGINEKPVVNLGGLQKEDDRLFFSRAVYVSKEDINYLDMMEQEGYRIEVQEVPSTNMQDYKKLRNKISEED